MDPRPRVRTLIAVGALLGAGAVVAQPLAPRGAVNLTALARLASVVRFFHPSDGVAAANWNALTVEGVEAVEGASDALDLAKRLNGWIAPVAPAVRVFPRGERLPPLADLAHPPAAGARILAWRHYGGRLDGHSKVLTSDRVDAAAVPFATLVQAIDPGALAGRNAELRAALRAELGRAGRLELGVRVDRRGGVSEPVHKLAAQGTAWRDYTIPFAIPADAERLTVVVVLTGEGRAWIDGVALTASAGAPSSAARLVNGDLDEGEPGRQPPGWLFPYEAVKAGYHVLVAEGDACRRGRCARLESDATVAWHPRDPADVLLLDLGAGVEAEVPISLYADGTGTLPPTSAKALPPA